MSDDRERDYIREAYEEVTRRIQQLTADYHAKLWPYYEEQRRLSDALYRQEALRTSLPLVVPKDFAKIEGFMPEENE